MNGHYPSHDPSFTAVGTDTLIHRHIHKYGFTNHQHDGKLYQQIALSDWDDSPQILCYDNSMGFYFVQLNSMEY